MFKRFLLATTIAVGLAAAGAATFAADPHASADHGHAAAQPHGGGAAPQAGHDEHAKPGLLDVNLMSALWVVVIFVVLLLILYPTAWKNVLAGLKAREQRIRNDIAEAESARARAEATLSEYKAQLAAAEEKVRQMIGSATAEGEKMAAQIRARGEAEANDAKTRAVREIDTAKKQAVAEIYDQAANLATSVAEKILRRNLNADDQRDLVSRGLDQIQDVNKN